MTVTAVWDEALHPRGPAGDPTGGQFVPADQGQGKSKEKKDEQKSKDRRSNLYSGPNMAYDPRRNRGPGYGKRGGDRRVRMLQQALNRLGLTDSRGRKLAVDGKLGPLTTQSIKDAQRKLGLKADGVVTPELLERLAKAKKLDDAKKPAPKKTSADADVIAFGDDGEPVVPNVLWDWRESLAREEDVNAPGGRGHDLRNYWVRGPGAAKIRWGTDGSFDRCVTNLGKYVSDPQGLCAEYHKAATGEWPAEKGVESAGDTEALAEDSKKPYGDVRYADPGYQEDGVERYPLDTEKHIRAAWSYINVPENAAKYSDADLRKVRARIRAAMRRIGADVSENESGVAAAQSDCPPGHHKMPSGDCMPDEEMTGDDAEAYAAEVEVAEAPAGATNAPWEGVLTVEGVESGDGRMFAANSLSWDEPPLPLMWQKETSHGGTNDKSVRVGSIERIWREPSPTGNPDVFIIRGEGVIDLENNDGAEVFRRMGKKQLRGNSVDVDSVKNASVELVYPQPPTTSADAAEAGEVTDAMMTFAQPELTIYHKGRIRATTLCEIPAFTEARLELVDAVTASADEECSECAEVDVTQLAPLTARRLDALTAATSVIQVSDAPPREWFNEPTDVMPLGGLTVTDEGRIYGYVAPAGVRHRSFARESKYVPLGNVDYSRFMGGETIVADGGRVTTGAITMDCGHATTAVRLSGQQAQEHYDNSCSVVATARVGENQHGVWIAGALLPDVTPTQLRKIMACRLSGDWRSHLDRPGWREFVAALLVPVPGFPMARVAPSVEVADGQLVASTVPVRFTALEQSSERRERIAAALRRLGRDPRSRADAATQRVAQLRRTAVGS